MEGFNLNKNFLPKVIKMFENNGKCAHGCWECPFDTEHTCSLVNRKNNINMEYIDSIIEYVYQIYYKEIDEDFKKYKIEVDEKYYDSMKYILDTNGRCINGKCTKCGLHVTGESCVRILYSHSIYGDKEQIVSNLRQIIIAKHYLNLLSEKKKESLKRFPLQIIVGKFDRFLMKEVNKKLFEGGFFNLGFENNNKNEELHLDSPLRLVNYLTNYSFSVGDVPIKNNYGIMKSAVGFAKESSKFEDDELIILAEDFLKNPKLIKGWGVIKHELKYFINGEEKDLKDLSDEDLLKLKRGE
jgi:hypothetical protein